MNDPHLALIRLVNHIVCKGTRYTVRIPCPEPIKHLLLPTLRYGAVVMTGEFDEYAGIHKTERNTLQRSAITREEMTARYLSFSAEDLRVARHPLRILKMSYINRMATRVLSVLPRGFLPPSLKTRMRRSLPSLTMPRRTASFVSPRRDSNYLQQ